MWIKSVLGTVGFSLAFFVLTLSANGAELRYIRIGEHTDHTRLVFEFNTAPTYEEPVLNGENEISVLFSNTFTVLPEKIPGETTERIEYLQFQKQDENLTAQIHLAFPLPKLTTLRLSDPPRLVLDIRPIDVSAADPPVRNSESTVADTQPPLPETAAGKEPPGKTEETGQRTDTARKSMSQTASASEIPPARTGTKTPLKSNDPARTPQRDSRSAVDTAETINRGEKVANTSPTGTPVQVYLLGALTVLSAMIVALLCTLVYKKNGVPSKNGLPDVDRATEDKIARLDNKIEDELEKLK
jgi:hypothetical protein